MKIADFFVALGFDIKGNQDLANVENTMGKAEAKALGLLAGVTALNAAFYLMMSTAAGAAVSLGKFALSTGLSADELQRWQYAGRLANVQADEMAAAFKAVQNAQTQLRLTGEGSAAFTFFGLSPNQSVADTLKTLHEVIQTGDVGASRMMAQQLGISENVFQFLRQADLGLDKFNEKLAMTAEHRKSLIAMNRAWQDLVATFDQVKNLFAESFSKPLTEAAIKLKQILSLLGVFVKWLGGASTAATVLRWALFGVVIVLGIVAIALTALTAILGVVIALVAVVELELAPLTLLAFVITAAIIALGIAVTLLTIGFVRLWASIHEGTFVENWVKRVTESFAQLRKQVEWLLSAGGLLSKTNLPKLGRIDEVLVDRSAHPVVGQPTVATIQQTNNISTNVDGAGDPQATGREVGKSVKQSVLEALYQGAAVVPNY